MISDYMSKIEVEKYYQNPQAIIDRAHQIRNEMIIECFRRLINNIGHAFKTLKVLIATRVTQDHVAPFVSPKRYKL